MSLLRILAANKTRKRSRDQDKRIKMGEKTKPGDGIKSLQTTNFFKILNFELYVKPNKIIMGVGAGAFLICLGYVTYMRYKYDNLGYYAGIDAAGQEQYYKKKSNWD